MAVAKNIRNKAGKYFLGKELQNHSRNHEFVGFEKSKSVGLLFDATNAEDLELVKRYVKYLKDFKKKVKAIGFFNVREVPEMVYSKLEFDYFTKKELNWYFKPQPAFVDQFIDEEFDILIDLNFKSSFSLKYISLLSKAKFKVGKFTEEHNEFDFMIEIPEDKGLKYFLRNFDIYIAQINTTKKEEKQQ